MTAPTLVLGLPAEPVVGSFVRADVDYNPGYPGGTKKPLPGGRVFVRVKDDLGDGWVPAYRVLPLDRGANPPRTWKALCAEALSVGGRVEAILHEEEGIPAPCCGQPLSLLQMREMVVAATRPRELNEPDSASTDRRLQ